MSYHLGLIITLSVISFFAIIVILLLVIYAILCYYEEKEKEVKVSDILLDSVEMNSNNISVDDSPKIPDKFLCPISGKLMYKPVRVITDWGFKNYCSISWKNRKDKHIDPISEDQVIKVQFDKDFADIIELEIRRNPSWRFSTYVDHIMHSYEYNPINYLLLLRVDKLNDDNLITSIIKCLNIYQYNKNKEITLSITQHMFKNLIIRKDYNYLVKYPKIVRHLKLDIHELTWMTKNKKYIEKLSSPYREKDQITYLLRWIQLFGGFNETVKVALSILSPHIEEAHLFFAIRNGMTAVFNHLYSISTFHKSQNLFRAIIKSDNTDILENLSTDYVRKYACNDDIFNLIIKHCDVLSVRKLRMKAHCYAFDILLINNISKFNWIIRLHIKLLAFVLDMKV